MYVSIQSRVHASWLNILVTASSELMRNETGVAFASAMTEKKMPMSRDVKSQAAKIWNVAEWTLPSSSPIFSPVSALENARRKNLQHDDLFLCTLPYTNF